MLEKDTEPSRCSRGSAVRKFGYFSKHLRSAGVKQDTNRLGIRLLRLIVVMIRSFVAGKIPESLKPYNGELIRTTKVRGCFRVVKETDGSVLNKNNELSMGQDRSLVIFQPRTPSLRNSSMNSTTSKLIKQLLQCKYFKGIKLMYEYRLNRLKIDSHTKKQEQTVTTQTIVEKTMTEKSTERETVTSRFKSTYVKMASEVKNTESNTTDRYHETITVIEQSESWASITDSKTDRELVVAMGTRVLMPLIKVILLFLIYISQLK